MLVKAIIRKEIRENIVLSYTFKDENFDIFYNDRKRASLHLGKLRKAIIANRHLGFEPFKNWINDINIKTFNEMDLSL
tara:strand:+ start:2366 stop:2599 length:234 start_codon:yes stop_codon:yes gene_type:complete